MWFGVGGGVIELVLILLRKVVLHRFVFLSPYVVWMAPATDTCFALVLVTGMLGLGWMWPQISSLRGAAFLSAFIASLSPLLMYGPLHPYAAVILAAGAAAQVSRLAAAHAARFDMLVRRTLVPLLSIVLILAAGVYGRRVLAQHRALAALPMARADAPNLLLIVLDTVRAQNLSVYGYARRTTPRLERLAATGVRFDATLSSAPWTLASHASIFTGRPVHDLSAGWMTALDAVHPTLAEVLSARGYLTAGFVANVDYCSRETGLDRGFAYYEDLRVSPELVLISSALGLRFDRDLHSQLGRYEEIGRKSAAQVNGEFLGWLATHDQRPFFAFLNYFDAHAPRFPPAPFGTKFGPGRPAGELPVQSRRLHIAPRRRHSPELRQEEIDAYDGAIAYMDEQIRLLLDELEQRRLLGNTLVIITADHGEEFREHGVFGHGDNLYMPVLHVPLLIAFPGRVPAGLAVRATVSLRDLATTALDLLAIDPQSPLPGQSLARYWSGTAAADASGPAPVLSELRYERTLPAGFRSTHTDLNSLVLPQYHYISSVTGAEELYDWQSDPAEQHDLAGADQSRPILERFRTEGILPGAPQS